MAKKLWNRDFILLLQGNAVSCIGDLMYSVAIGYWVYEQTGSSALMGIMSAISMFVTMFLSPFTGSIVRNNVSVNDGKVKGELIAVVGPVEGTTVCNNTFYASEPVERVVEFFSGDGKTYASNMTFKNNIFIMDGVDNQFHILGDKADTIKFDNNLYWGKHCGVPISHTNAHVMDPQLEQPGRRGDGRAVADFYRPKADSPVRTLGVDCEGLDGVDFSGHHDGEDHPYLGAWK